MKSDRKMTEEILERVNVTRAKRKSQKSLAIKTMGGFFAFVLVFALSFSFFASTETPVTSETASKTEVSVTGESHKLTEAANKSYSLIIANAAEESTEICKENSVSMPMTGLLYVKDTRDMSTETSIIAYEASQKLKEYGESDKWSVMGIDGDIAVYFATLDYLRLNIADPAAVENIVLTCGVNGELMISDRALLGNLKEYMKTIKKSKEIIVTGEEYKNIYSENEGMIIKWTPSEELHEVFCANPATPLSEVSDEITGVINYIDGSCESFRITLSFNDNGILTAAYSCSK